MTRTTGGSPKARIVGAELRRAREEHDVGVRELARRLGMDHSKLSRCESGKTAASPEFVASVLAALGVPEAERERVIELARGADRTNWLSPGLPSADHELTTLIEFEKTASEITEVSPFVISGLLQTSNYARAVMTSGTESPGDLETRVTLRVGRRDVLTRKKGPRFTFLVMETALRTKIGGPVVMADQLRQVVTMSEWPSVTVRVIPADLNIWHPALHGSYILFEFPKADPIVHLEQYASAVFLHEREQTDAYRSATDTLRGLAMSPDDSVKLIAEVAEEMENMT
ncbi:helix-turn-helix domain-containing protein [Saccharopolyspora hordei]|uniref:Transcriptional regulator with XRE-family HTH domain n=1 Tax=Saccharopolyspora hordei TaxID=1838 RepID=A0A853ASW0_9PSEU|nr:helix-turn-helix transcriptional regulator [Saccharopolyspora hordei]NYI85540.1 transcriptional regulator with XRE-family HTH domain [Saccharopolyspora hordei]